MARTRELTELMGLFDNGSNMWGQLNPDIRARLYEVVEEPSQHTWDNAHSIILVGGPLRGSTLWQALLKRTDYHVTRGPAGGGDWAAIPTRQQILTALRMVLGGAR